MVAGGEMTNVSATTTSRRYYLSDKKKKRKVNLEGYMD